MEILAAIIGFLGIVFICFALYIIATFNKPKQQQEKNYKNSTNLMLWNKLWKEICDKFQIGIYKDGIYGGQPAKHLLNMVKNDYGLLDEDQIQFVRELIFLLDKVLDEQVKQEIQEYSKTYYLAKSKLDLKPSLN